MHQRLRVDLSDRARTSGLAASRAQTAILDEFEAADETFDAARAGRTGTFRVTAVPMWIDAVLPPAMARFHAELPGIRLVLDTATRAEGLRRLAGERSDLHCGGIDDGELLPATPPTATSRTARGSTTTPP